MAVTATNILAGGVASASSFTSAPFTPLAGRLYLAAVAARSPSGYPPIPTMDATNGLTWVPIVPLEVGLVGRLTLFRALETSGLSTGAATVSFAGQTQTQIFVSINEFDGVDRSGADGENAIVKSAIQNNTPGTSGSVGLGAFADAVNNAVFGCFQHLASEATTPEAYYSTAVLADTPKGYWRLGEASGTFADSSGFAHTATGTGGFTYGVGGATLANNAITLNGTTGYLAAADHADFDLGDVFTLECWVKTTTYGTTQGLIGKGSNAYLMRLKTSGGHLFLNLLRESATDMCTATVQLPEDGQWHHLVATKTGATINLYQDGVDVTGAITNATCTDNATALSIGREGVGSNLFNGSIDEAAVYATALSAARVSTHYLSAPAYIELSDQNLNTTALQTEWKTGEDLSVSASWGTSSAWGGIAVELAVYTTIIASGEAHLTGTGSLTATPYFTVPKTAILAGFGFGPGDTVTNWTDITDYARSCTWQRGRQNELNQTQAGTGTLVLRDSESHFDPNNTDSPFYPHIRPNTPVKALIVAGDTIYPIFSMYMERLPRSLRVTDVYTERQISLIDGFALLANAGIAGFSYASEPTDERFTNVLDDIGWPTDARRIGSGASAIVAANFAADADTRAQSHLLNVADSENGLFFCDGSGNLVFIGRRELLLDPAYTLPVATFQDENN